MQQPQRLILACLGLLVFLNTVATTWLPSLRLIIWAFFAGCFLAVLLLAGAVLLTSDNNNAHVSTTPLRQIRPLGFTVSATWHQEVAASKREDTFERKPLYPASQPISQALDGILSHVNRDFIASWYEKVSPDPSFSLQVENVIRHTVERIVERVQTLDVPEVLVGRIAPLLTAHLHDFSAAERAVRGRHLNNNLTESEELDLAIAKKYRDGKLHTAASLGYSDMKQAQQDHLRKLADKILPLVLSEKEVGSKIVSIIAREIIACAVLFPTLVMLSDPDTWNRIIEALGSATLQDRKTVRKLRAALDQHATPHSPDTRRHSRPSLGEVHTQQFIRLTPRDDERTFERFIRSIRLCNNLSDARRLRNEITAQLKRDAKSEGVEGYAVYLRRLETGKRLIEQKVAHLSAGPGARHSVLAEGAMVRSQSEVGIKNPTARLESATLEEVMQDSAGLSYFMEYMDRKKKLALVQFWLVVSGLRNPLEDDVPSSDDEDSVATVAANFLPWTASDRNDIAQIHDAYLSKPELGISDRPRRAIKQFLKNGDKATQIQYVRARYAILRAQTAVYNDMQKNYFPGFRASDLWYKFLASGDRGSAATGIGAGQGIFAEEPGTPAPRGSSGRHSFDGRSSVDAPDIWDLDPLSASAHNIGGSTEWNAQDDTFLGVADADTPGMLTPESNIVEAMEAALNDIIQDRPGAPEGGRDSPSTGAGDPSPRSSLEFVSDESKKSKVDTPQKEANAGPPSLSSLGLLSGDRSSGVFKEDLFPEEHEEIVQSLVEDDYQEVDKPIPEDSDEEIHQAAPGDLGLAEAIVALTYDIEKLCTQEAVIDSLYRKAELTNNTVELRILRKSKSSLQREIRRKELQRQQYIIQESDNSLYGRSEVRIKSTMVGNENGQEYALYIIEVQREGGEQLPAAQWIVARRYSEFLQLHQQLKRFESVRDLEFPRRRVVLKLQRDFLEKRRMALERYIKSLLLIPEVCRSREFRAFLSQQNIQPAHDGTSGADTNQKDLMSRLYASIADVGNLPILDQLSLASANIIAAATNQLQTPQPDNNNKRTDENVSAIAEAEAELNAFDEPFVKPVCDLFLEVFELNRKSNWLRGRAVVVVLHQLLGGTIERKIRDQTKALLDEETMLGHIQKLSEALWPNGELMMTSSAAASTPRTQKEKSKTRTEATVMLASLVPELSASVVGRANAKSAARRLSAVCNNQRLNTSILYTVLDVLIEEVFGIQV
ncbi:PXA domain-containing protein [Sphaerosporella brunnea]|uniref:PXA domain-containing protein n=1 Tax=Sphaerosporella brunnea TaxID=1250544 RepID=A0A5J5EZP7_9PEZI|nr:PXA domain-containing protein [Sphaerosporella brunnea]